MSIVYLHGVGIRDQKVAPIIAGLLEKYVAPVVLPGAEGASVRDRIFSAYWGGHAVSFAWNRSSLPPDATSEASQDQTLELVRWLVKERSNRASADAVGTPITTLADDRLSSILAAALQGVDSKSSLSTRFRAVEPSGNNPHSAGDHLALLASEIVMRWRPALNAVLTQFFGDIFAYLARRGDADSPGPIVTDFLDVLMQASRAQPEEPLIVLSHSMGGQIVYDCVTYYIPRIKKYSKLKVDFWSATGSQVPLFEEMKLFKVSDASIRAPSKVDVPRMHLGYWHNVWDPNDLLSYTAEPIFHDVYDEKFESHLPIHTAHFGYLVSPDFYSRLAKKVVAVMRT
jgi:hypothetical protein